VRFVGAEVEAVAQRIIFAVEVDAALASSAGASCGPVPSALLASSSRWLSCWSWHFACSCAPTGVGNPRPRYRIRFLRLRGRRRCSCLFHRRDVLRGCGDACH